MLHHDPLRDEPVEATTVEILEDFLRLIGKETELEQMREKGTLQETADWIDTQIGTFLGLLSDLRNLFTAAWDAIQPENLPDIMTNLRSLAGQAGDLLQRLFDFAATVALKVLELVKNALLAALETFVDEVPGWHLLTVILGRNPITGEVVPRTAVNIIKGFISLLPGGNQIFQQLQETGVVSEAGARIEGALADLGISWEFVVGLFTGIWESLSIDDLVDPIGAFTRIRDQFGEPISRLFAFIRVVVEEVFKLILALMNFPTDILGRIIANAMQAFEDIKRDPIGFLKNMLAAVKLGLSNFFDNFLAHLVNGLVDWLFKGLRDAGIEPPEDLSLGSILELVLDVLGISMDRIWEKLAERFGQERIDQIRGAVDRLVGIWNFIKDVQERGVAAIWEYIEGQISNLWNMVLEAATNWIMEKIVSRVTAKLLSMLDPTGIMAVINGFIAFFNAVQSAIEYIREILEIVDSYVATLAAVAAGDIEPGAARMEGGLAAAIPVAIGFLANQVGLGNIGEKIQEIVAGIRETVDNALDWLLDRLEEAIQGVMRLIGMGGEEDEAAGPAAPITIHEEFTAGGADHDITNREGSDELVMSSTTATPLSAHPDADVRAAYAKYLADTAAATSASGKRQAANRNLRIIVTKVKAAGGQTAPGASAPGIGTIDLHKNQQSRLRTSGIDVWFLESEHVIPRAFVNEAFRAAAQAGVPAGRADYRNMHTLLIYKGAADLKTDGSFGDAAEINNFKADIRELAAVGLHPAAPIDVRAEMGRAVFSLMSAYASDSKERTKLAIRAENRTNGAARGPAGSPEPPLPGDAAVDTAYDRQRSDINAQLERQLNEFLARRARSGP